MNQFNSRGRLFRHALCLGATALSSLLLVESKCSAQNIGFVLPLNAGVQSDGVITVDNPAEGPPANFLPGQTVDRDALAAARAANPAANPVVFPGPAVALNAVQKSDFTRTSISWSYADNAKAVNDLYGGSAKLKFADHLKVNFLKINGGFQKQANNFQREIVFSLVIDVTGMSEYRDVDFNDAQTKAVLAGFLNAPNINNLNNFFTAWRGVNQTDYVWGVHRRATVVINYHLLFQNAQALRNFDLGMKANFVGKHFQAAFSGGIKTWAAQNGHNFEDTWSVVGDGFQPAQIMGMAANISQAVANQAGLAPIADGPNTEVIADASKIPSLINNFGKFAGLQGPLGPIPGFISHIVTRPWLPHLANYYNANLRGRPPVILGVNRSDVGTAVADIKANLANCADLERAFTLLLKEINANPANYAANARNTLRHFNLRVVEANQILNQIYRLILLDSEPVSPADIHFGNMVRDHLDYIFGEFANFDPFATLGAVGQPLITGKLWYIASTRGNPGALFQGKAFRWDIDFYTAFDYKFQALAIKHKIEWSVDPRNPIPEILGSCPAEPPRPMNDLDILSNYCELVRQAPNQAPNPGLPQQGMASLYQYSGKLRWTCGSNANNFANAFKDFLINLEAPFLDFGIGKGLGGIQASSTVTYSFLVWDKAARAFVEITTKKVGVYAFDRQGFYVQDRNGVLEKL